MKTEELREKLDDMREDISDWFIDLWEDVVFWLKELFTSIGNLFSWFTVVWNDRDENYAWVYPVLYRKIMRLADKIRKSPDYEDREFDLSNMERACEILKKLNDGGYLMCEESAMNEELFAILANEMTNWWN
jgi:hypothetical protein